MSKTCEMIHQWGYEDWFHRRDDLLFQGSVHSGIFSKQRLVLLELFSSERLFLGAPHALWLVAWVVRQHKFESCLFHLLLVRNRQHEVSVSASSKVRRHRRLIPTHQLMYFDQSFSGWFSSDICKDGRR